MVCVQVGTGHLVCGDHACIPGARLLVCAALHPIARAHASCWTDGHPQTGAAPVFCTYSLPMVLPCCNSSMHLLCFVLAAALVAI